MKKIKAALFIIVISITLFSVISCNKKVEESESTSLKVEFADDDIISKEEALKDLEYIKGKISNIHPKPFGEIGEESYKIEYEAIAKNIHDNITYKEFNILAQKLVSLTEDANTGVEFLLPVKSLPFEIKASLLGIWVDEDYEKLKKGDMIKKIGRKPVEEICKNFQEIISKDNEYTFISKLPEMLNDVKFLEHFGLLDDKGRLQIEVLGNNGDNKIQFVKLNNYIEDADDNNIEYDINSNDKLGVLKIYNLNIKQKDIDVINSFFKEVDVNSIDKIALDLRDCQGNEEDILKELLKYIDIDYLRNYDVNIKKSEEAEQNGIKRKNFILNMFTSNKIKSKKIKNMELYDGKIYVLTSFATCKKGVEIAAILKDSNVAKLVGQYPAYSPNKFGNAIECTTPLTQLKFQVSTSTITRPSGIEGDILTLDKYVLVKNNISKKADSVLNEVINLN